MDMLPETAKNRPPDLLGPWVYEKLWSRSKRPSDPQTGITLCAGLGDVSCRRYYAAAPLPGDGSHTGGPAGRTSFSQSR